MKNAQVLFRLIACADLCSNYVKCIPAILSTVYTRIYYDAHLYITVQILYITCLEFIYNIYESLFSVLGNVQQLCEKITPR